MSLGDDLRPGTLPPHKRIRLNRKNGIPLHLQLERHLEYLICAGIYREGELLPSIRFLAGHLQLSPGTVRRTYSRLTERGLVGSRQGHGFTVTWRRNSAHVGALDIELRGILETPIRRARALGFSNEQVVRGALDLLAGFEGRIRVVFVGFNEYVARRYATLLEEEFREFGLSVAPLTLRSLTERDSKASREVMATACVITQLYHLGEVERLVRGMGCEVVPVMVTLSRATHEKLASLRPSGRIGIVCPEPMAPATLDAVATYYPARRSLVFATPDDPGRVKKVRACSLVITNGIAEDQARRLLGEGAQILPLIYVPTLESLNRLRLMLSRPFVQPVELPAAAGGSGDE